MPVQRTAGGQATPGSVHAATRGAGGLVQSDCAPAASGVQAPGRAAYPAQPPGSWTKCSQPARAGHPAQ